MYKDTPSDLRHRAWGNEGLDESEVPYAVEEWNRGNDSNPPAPTSGTIAGAPNTQTPSLAEHGPRGCFILSKGQPEII